METTRRAQLVMDVLRHAAAADHDEAMRLMGEIAQASDGNQMYGVCCGLAEAGRQALVRMYGHPSREGLWALTAPDPADGLRHPAHTFALRFITAFINGDLPTCQALYMTAARASAEDYAHSVTAIVGYVARLAQIALEEPAADVETAAAHPH
ncbi:hypothetical protein ACFWVC_26915 [Streptomyces sp. NPDC058691]|uniref:hypothetical protein n=1 Tax=Streptomyces sp. NPDC058691 TaxID=3346601 RepID=UPI00365C01EA